MRNTEIVIVFRCDVTPTDKAKEYLSNILEHTLNQTNKENMIRDDQACLLVLACATFRSIPERASNKSNMKKYLFYKQESIGHARWLTSANGYLRMKLFGLYNFSIEQQISLNKIVQFIVDVYAPSFFEIFFHPQAVQGPKVVLKVRDFMRASTVSLPAKNCFIQHAVSWLNPTTAALSVLDSDIDVSHLAARSPNTKALLWSDRPLVAFLNATTATSPCLTRGSKADWMAFRNNNTCCERLIGRMKDVLVKRCYRMMMT